MNNSLSLAAAAQRAVPRVYCVTYIDRGNRRRYGRTTAFQWLAESEATNIRDRDRGATNVEVIEAEARWIGPAATTTKEQT